MRKGTHVRISRRWQHPEITIDVTDAEISIDMELGAFLEAVVSEVRNPATILTRAQLLDRLKSAAEVVTDGMKHETTAIVRPRG